jgi:DNA-binding Lrp family transcriptional regulator
MVIGMTMIKVKPGQDSIAYESIQSIKGVKEIYRIFGEYSFFLIVEAYRKRELDQIIDEICMRMGVVEIRPVLVTEDIELPCPNVSESEEPTLSCDWVVADDISNL